MEQDRQHEYGTTVFCFLLKEKYVLKRHTKQTGSTVGSLTWSITITKGDSTNS